MIFTSHRPDLGGDIAPRAGSFIARTQPRHRLAQVYCAATGEDEKPIPTHADLHAVSGAAARQVARGRQRAAEQRGAAKRRRANAGRAPA